MYIQSKDITQIIILFMCLLPSVLTSSAPESSKRNNKRRKSYFSEELIKKYQKIYSGKYLAREVAKQHTSSDAMELYSVAAKKVLRVQEKKDLPLYDPEYDLVVTNKKGFKQNKFVTETISFQNLRIKSQDNNQYLCVKNTEVHFMVDKYRPSDRKSNSTTRMNSVMNKKNKARKRCQFTWDFTNQMHIQLSTSVKGSRLYLTVKNGLVTLTQRHESTELERSFIWVPTMSAGNDDNENKINMKNNKKNKRNLPVSGRNFPSDGDDAIASSLRDAETNTCSDLLSTIMKKSMKISMLKEEIKTLKEQLAKSSSKL